MNPSDEALSQLPEKALSYRAFELVWQVFVHLLCPFALLHFLNRSRREPLYRKHFSHRFGFGPVAPKGAVWVFATSLGETRAASPLIHRLLDEGHAICLSHASPAGLSEGRRLFNTPKVTHRYVPFDLFWATALFLVRQRPSVGLVIEGEYWPGHLQVAQWFAVPMLHINGNLHLDAVKRSGFLRRFRLNILKRFHAITTKGPAQKALYESVGVDSTRVFDVGELKFDQTLPAEQIEAGKRLRIDWAASHPVFLIASSVVDEEPDLLSIVTALLALKSPPKVIWAPRSPQRFDALFETLEAAGIRVSRRSGTLNDALDGHFPAETQVVLGDSLGEMNVWYQMADIIFVGATLCDHGGHNISEPLAQGRPVLIGPSTFGITFSAEAAVKAGAARIVSDAEALGDALSLLVANSNELESFAKQTKGFAASHLGAAKRTQKVIQRFAPLDTKT